MNYVLKLNEIEAKRVIKFYRDYQKETNNINVLFFAKTDLVSITVYKSYKVMFQGVDAVNEYNMWNVMLDKETVVTKEKTKDSNPNNYFVTSIGSDEVGTGDFFGPMVVCAAYITPDLVPFLKTLGIDDSKKITDEKIRVIGQQLKDKVTYSMLALHNDKFNEMFERGYNMNKLKAYLHNSAFLQLTKKAPSTTVVLDQFCSPELYFRYLNQEQTVFKDITFTTKAESKYASVAIGSIIARYAFLQYFDLMIEESGYPLLKGASHKVDKLTAQIIKEKGESFLRKYAKMNFVTLQKAKDLIT